MKLRATLSEDTKEVSHITEEVHSIAQLVEVIEKARETSNMELTNIMNTDNKLPDKEDN